MTNIKYLDYETSSTTPYNMVLNTGVAAQQLVWNVPASSGQLGISASQISSGVPPGESQKRVLGLTLYFKFVRSKFTKLEKTKIKRAVERYNALRFEASELGQRGLYEQVSEQLLLAVREQQLLACGLDTMVLRADVQRFMEKVQDKVVLMPLHQFPRVIPPDVSKTLKRVQGRKLFDSYVVLFHPAAEEKPLMTHAEKVRKKDPILFGVFANAPERLYFIADWMDEHCDLTLERLVGELKTMERDYLPGKIRVPTPKDVENLKAEVMTRIQRLAATNASNFRVGEAEAKDEEKAKPKWWGARFKTWLAGDLIPRWLK